MTNAENMVLLKFWGTFLTVQSYFKPVPYATAVKTFTTVITDLLKLIRLRLLKMMRTKQIFHKLKSTNKNEFSKLEIKNDAVTSRRFI